MAASKKSRSPRAKTKRNVADKRTSAKAHGENALSRVVTVDRRENRDRRGGDRRTEQTSVAVERRSLERRVKVNRRRQIDPTTCERDYTVDEIEFMAAVDEYKRRNGRMFPTCSELLEVIRTLGYQKQPKIEPMATPVVETIAVSIAEVGPTVCTQF
jgi:hypothetical protein